MLLSLTSGIKPVQLYNLYNRFGLLSQPDIQIESAATANLESFSNPHALFTGQSNLLVTPLQVALAYAPFSNGGYFINPVLVAALREPGKEWELSASASETQSQVNEESITLAPLTESGNNSWSVSATVPTESGSLDWYVQGTPLNWPGVPMVLVVALEDSTPSITAEIGSSIFDYVTHQ